MKVSDCVCNCSFMQMRKYGLLSRKTNEYRCHSPKAPEKKGHNLSQLVPGYLIYRLKSCPEGLI